MATAGYLKKQKVAKVINDVLLRDAGFFNALVKELQSSDVEVHRLNWLETVIRIKVDGEVQRFHVKVTEVI